MWSASQHREQLKQFPTLYRDPRLHPKHFILKALPVHYFVRLDIEEIFMSGDPEIWHVMQLDWQKRVRGNDYYTMLTISFSLISL